MRFRVLGLWFHAILLSLATYFCSMKSWLILLGLALTWGSSYILIKRGLVAFSAVQLAALRILISAIAFLPIYWWNRKQVDWSNWPFFLVVGLAGSALPAFLFATAQTQLSSSLAGMLSSLTPIFTLLLGVLFFGIPFEWQRTAGILAGLLGACLLVSSAGSNTEQESIPLAYALMVVAATALYATSSNTVQRFLKAQSSVVISSVSFLLMGPLGLGILFASPFLQTMHTHPAAWSSVGYISILALFGTVLASIFFFRLVQLRDALFASIVSYLVPIVAMLWGLFDQEGIRGIQLLGTGLILAGVYLSRKR